MRRGKIWPDPTAPFSFTYLSFRDKLDFISSLVLFFRLLVIKNHHVKHSFLVSFFVLHSAYMHHLFKATCVYKDY